MDTGSREENASKQESRAPFRFHRNGNSSSRGDRLQNERDRIGAAGINWPDLNPDMASVEALVTKVRREHVAYVDGRFIPGLTAIFFAITNWQGEIDLALTLFGTHRELLEPGNSTRTALIDFASRHPIAEPAQPGNSRGIGAR